MSRTTPSHQSSTENDSNVAETTEVLYISANKYYINLAVSWFQLLSCENDLYHFISHISPNVPYIIMVVSLNASPKLVNRLWKTMAVIRILYSSSHSQMFFKIGIHKNLIILTGKRLCRNLFLIQLLALRLTALLKRETKRGIFLWNLQNFYYLFLTEHFLKISLKRNSNTCVFLWILQIFKNNIFKEH